MDLTPNYGLGKPTGLENADIEVINTNMDTLDTEIKAIDTRLDAEEAKTAAFKIWVGTATINIAAAGNGTVGVDISSAGFVNPPAGVSVLSHNFSYYGYYASGSTQTKDITTVGVRHFNDTSATTSVTVRVIAIGT